MLAPPWREGFGLTWQNYGADVALQRLEANLSKRQGRVLRGTRARALKLGDGRAKGTNVGPLINEPALKKVEQYVDIGVKEGADLLIGGSRARGTPRAAASAAKTDTTTQASRPTRRARHTCVLRMRECMAPARLESCSPGWLDGLTFALDGPAGIEVLAGVPVAPVLAALDRMNA